MQKRYQKVLSAVLLAVLLFSASAGAAAQGAANSASAEGWTEVRTSSRGNLVVGDGSAVSIRSGDIQELAGNLNVLGNDFKASKKDLGARLSFVEGELRRMDSSFQAGVNSIAEALKKLGYAPAGYDPGNPTPDNIIEAIRSLSSGAHSAGYAKGLAEGEANAAPKEALTEFVLLKSYVFHQWSTNHHTTNLTQNVTAYRVSEDGRLDVSATLEHGEIYNRPGYYIISANCTTKRNNHCIINDGCFEPDLQMAEVTLLRDATVRFYRQSGITEESYKSGDTFRLMSEEAFVLL